MFPEFNNTISDISSAFQRSHLWVALGWQDIISRYRRSSLGPLWLTISMVVTVTAMGPLYGVLFGFDFETFIPHLALGLIFWGFISTSIIEFGDAFFLSSNYLKQASFPLTIFILRVCYRNLIILGHNIVIYPIIMLILGITPDWLMLLAAPALVLVFANLFWIGMVLAFFCTRYRDMVPIISSLMTLMFFMTPIVWKVEQLPESRQFLAKLNPFSAYLELLRQPLSGKAPELFYWYYSGATLIVGIVLGVIFMTRYRHRVAYWL